MAPAFRGTVKAEYEFMQRLGISTTEALVVKWEPVTSASARLFPGSQRTFV